MALVRTLQPQLINSRLGISDIVYIQIGKRIDPDDSNSDVVSFDIIMSVLKVRTQNEIKLVPNNTPNMPPIQVPIIKAYPQLVPFEVTPALFRRSTFEGVLGNPTKEQCEALIIPQINFVTEKWENGSWTGEEVQKQRYWDLKTADMVFMTNEEVTAMLTPYEVE